MKSEKYSVRTSSEIIMQKADLKAFITFTFVYKFTNSWLVEHPPDFVIHDVSEFGLYFPGTQLKQHLFHLGFLCNYNERA